jgi:hypothetical protein
MQFLCGASGERLGNEHRVMKGSFPLQKLVGPFHHVWTQGEGAIYELGSTPSPDTEAASVLILKFPLSRIMKNYVYKIPNQCLL